MSLVRVGVHVTDTFTLPSQGHQGSASRLVLNGVGMAGCSGWRFSRSLWCLRWARAQTAAADRTIAMLSWVLF